jgi:hypothetical protein
MISLGQIRPETIQRLALLAESKGFRSIDEFVAAISSNSSDSGRENISVTHLSPEEKAKQWELWIGAHSLNAPHFIDVDRDSLYTREDELL